MSAWGAYWYKKTMKGFWKENFDMENESKVKIKIFGKERTVEICLVGDNDSERLTKEEEKLLKWICSVDFDIHKDKIIKYINYLNDIIGEYKHDDYDLSNDEVFLPTAILINVTDSMDEDTAEVALFAESDKYAIDEGIMIAFKDSEYFGISGFNDCMNDFEDENFDEYNS